MKKWLSEIGEKLRNNRESYTQYWFYIVLCLGSAIMGAIIVIAIYVFLLRGTVIFLRSDDKYDVFVTLLLIFLTLLGILGYGMYIWISSKIENRLDKRLQKEEQEIEISRNLFRTRIQRNMGYILWKLFAVEKKKEEGKNTSVLKELIKLAIKRTEQSLNFVIKLPKNEYKEDINQCKANWVYFLAEAARIEGYEVTKKDKEQALFFVNEILAEVSEQDYPDYYEYKESCAWALHHLSEEDDDVTKQKASDIIHELLKDASIPSDWRKENEEKWAHF
jgi:hypothetical protein